MKRPQLRRAAAGPARKLAALCLASLATLQVTAAAEPCVCSLAFTRDGRTLASGHLNRVQVWDFQGARPSYAFDVEGRAWSVAFNRRGSLLAIGTDERAYVHQASAGGKQRTLTYREVRYASLEGANVERQEVMAFQKAHSIGFDAYGRTLFTGSNQLKLWDVRSGALMRTADIDDSERDSVGAVTRIGVIKAAYSPNGKTIAAATRFSGVHFYESATLRKLGSIAEESRAIYAIAYSPDGKILASAGDGSGITLWDLATARRLRVLSGYSDPVYAVAFSKDGKTLASGGGPRDGTAGTVKLWSMPDGKELQTLDQQPGAVQAILFSPDGAVMVTGSYAGIINVWDYRKAKLLRTLDADTPGGKTRSP